MPAGGARPLSETNCFRTTSLDNCKLDAVENDIPALKASQGRKTVGKTGDKAMTHYTRAARQWKWKIYHNSLGELINLKFPGQDDYYDSQWHDWEERIKDGHNAEEKQIKRLYKIPDKSFMPDDPLRDELAGEEYSKACDITNNMYGGLIVSIWSKMDSFLKSIVRAHCTEPEKTKKYQFKGVKQHIKKKAGIDLEKCNSFKVVNAVRILNNAFKHNSGYYTVKEDDHYNQIDHSLLVQWGLPNELDERNEIDYSKLPIQNIVVACNTFCTDLLDKVVKQKMMAMEKADRISSKKDKND